MILAERTGVVPCAAQGERNEVKRSGALQYFDNTVLGATGGNKQKGNNGKGSTSCASFSVATK